MESVARSLAGAIAAAFRRHLVDEGLPQIGRCVALLDAEQIWRRQGALGNSVGNLLLHLEGNVRQWILCGVGGAVDTRDRAAEFAARGEVRDAAALFEALRATVLEAARVVDGLSPEQMVAVRTFQGRFEREVAGALLHVLEHFSGHAYQIYAWTKAMAEVDLAFWEL
jgi:uncharacterized damage-inducible protein DinB